MKKLVGKNPLFYAFFFPSIVDGVVTFVGQGEEYWSITRTVNEASPAYYFLKASPFLFLCGSILWFVLWYLFFQKFKHERIKLWLSLLFIAGHSLGSGSWMVKFFKDSNMWTVQNMPLTNLMWLVLVCYFGVIAFFAGATLNIYFEKGEK